MARTEVRYRLRSTGATVTEAIEGEGALRWAYEHPLGSRLFRALAAGAGPSRLYGWWQDQHWSAGAIPAFIARHGLDPGEFEVPPGGWPSFNAFFERRLKASARPLAPEPGRLLSPGDGKALCMSLAPGATVRAKGVAFSPEALLAGAPWAGAFVGGEALVLRLAPYDYHRFHFPAAGEASEVLQLPGAYDSVNPIALAARPGLLARNARHISRLDTEAFGPIALVEVGAFNVASILQLHQPGPVDRGQEKGTFRFGGSTVVMLVGPGRVRWDEDLKAASAEGLELAVRMGEGLGWATGP